MISANDFIRQVYIPLQEGWGYIWGTYGQTWTASSRITSSAPASSKQQAALYGSKWIGKRVTDCSGLLYWAAKQLGLSIPHGANSIFNSYCSSKGKITAGIELKPGTAVFLYDPKQSKPRHHVGVYVGNDTVIESKGTRYGVVTSPVSHWDEWGEIRGIDYSDAEGLVIRMSLQNGSTGASVKELQQNLLQLGYALPKYGADGPFGNETLTAVRQFQSDHGLLDSGIMDEATEAAITAALKQKPDLTDRVEALETAVMELQEKLNI